MSEEGKKISLSFKCYEREVADFRIRLRYDNLNKTQFFNSIIRLYIDNDSEMLDVIGKIKEKEKAMGKRKIQKARSEIDYAIELSGNEKENLFDLIESFQSWRTSYEE